jgi:acyl dehydratase
MVEVGQELPELGRVVTGADVKAYADAGGDQNPLHQDEAFARSVGFPGTIAHGMFTMGHMAAAAAAFAGDAANVRTISAQFREPVYMGERIVAGGRVAAVQGDTARLDMWVRVERAGETLWPIKKGVAVIRLT